MENNKILKKQIIYRSKHRGTKEMDILLGTFVKKNINSFNKLELLELKKILEIDDEILHKWYFDMIANHTIPKSNVSKKLKNFRL